MVPVVNEESTLTELDSGLGEAQDGVEAAGILGVSTPTALAGASAEGQSNGETAGMLRVSTPTAPASISADVHDNIGASATAQNETEIIVSFLRQC